LTRNKPLALKHSVDAHVPQAIKIFIKRFKLTSKNLTTIDPLDDYASSRQNLIIASPSNPISTKTHHTTV
jgi:hypothetical protein